VTTSKERDYYTVAEVARMLNVSHSTVWRWIKAGRLPAYRAGGRNLRVRPADLNSGKVPEPRDQEWEPLSLAERRAKLLRPLTEEEAQEQKELYEEAVKDRERYSIAPMTTDELIRLSRDRDFWYGPGE
jgi:excisionase family DNA binding protein